MARSPKQGYKLSYILPTLIGGKLIVNISDEILASSNPKWKECLVGYYVGKKLPFKMTENALKNVWGAHVVEVLANEDGFYFFHISDEAIWRKLWMVAQSPSLGFP